VESNNFDTAKKPLILIVDDIPKNLQVLSNILNSDGYQISFASNGEQALSVVDSTLPDLILLDIMMPEMDGFEVCKRLKNNQNTKNIPIIFLTGKAETEDIVKGLKLGAVDYITKPFNSIELLSRVHTHLELKLSRDTIIKYNQELTKAKEDLAVLNANKDKFFSIISHDLRGPFSGFLGLSELLSDEFENLERDEISKIGDSMNKAAKRLFSLIENLLEWSRSQMGKIENNPINMDLKQSCNRIFSIFSNTAEAKKIKLINKVPEDIIIFADNMLLNTILRNLISNAIKFTHENGEIKVDSIDSQDSNFYEVSVSDNGVGMNKEAMDKIFRIDAKHSTVGTAKEQGTGLGLLLCKEFVEKGGGKLWVESTVGIGTKFSFTIQKAKY
jgi:two-component system, sensor histidine kinase and response regulator